MSTITLPNIRVSSDLTVKVRLKDGGVAIDWSTLSNIRALIYSDAQKAMAGRCVVTVDAEDATLLVCQYAANKPQYIGVNRIVISATYLGEMKTYDKPALNFVRWTDDQAGQEITISDPDVEVEIEVEDVSSSILQEAVDAAFSAAERAEEAAAAAEHMVDIHTGPAGKSPYIGENGHWYEWDEDAGEYVDTETEAQGETGTTPDITIGTVTTAEPGTPAAATMTGTPEAPVLNLTIPKGVAGDTPAFTVGEVTTGQPGTPVVVTITGTDAAPVLNVTIPQGLQGNTGSSVDYPYELVNNLTTNDATKGLSAAQGKVLKDEITQLEHEVTPIAIPITATGKYIKTDGDIGSTLPSPTTSANYRYMRLAVVPGDTLLVTAQGGSSPRIWCFVDSDNKILSHASNLSGVVSVTLTAPTNAAAVIINDKNTGNTSYYISKDTLLYKVRGVNVATANNNGFIKNTVTGGDGVSKDIITKVSGTNIYVPNADISQIATYENCVKEVWVNPKTLTGISHISLSRHGSYVYLYGKPGVDSSATWTARKDITNESDNVIIPIPVTSAGGSANLGDIAGYVVFSDIATFRSNSYSGTKAFINKNRAISLDYNREIWYGIMLTPATIDAEISNALAGGLEIVLPSVIYAAVGVQLNIYNDTIALSMDRGLDSPLNYIVRWNCSKGVVTNRCFRWTPKATDVGNTTITCYVYTTAGVLIASKSATIKVVSGSIDSAKNVLFVGDSTGADSAAALYADFANASMYSGVAPVFVGSKGTTPKHEAFGGARWADFATEGRAAYRCQVSGVGPIALNSQYTNNGFTWTVVEVNVTDGVGNILITKFSLASNQDAPEANGVLVPTGGGDSIPYTDATRAPGNPFWHDGAIDFSHYRSTIGLEGKIDAIIFLLGLNGDEALDDTEQYINDLYDAAVADNEDCIVIVCLITGPANTVDAYGVDYGAGNWLNLVKKFHNRRKLYVEMAEGGDYPNMRIAPTNFYIDRYYGYRLGTRAVSARNATTETYHTNYVHPASSGYAQIGDALFPAVIATMNE